LGFVVGGFAVEVAGNAAGAAVIPFGGGLEDGLEFDEMDGLPFTCPDVETLPKALTPSDFTVGAAAGDDEIGADASSIDPKVTAVSYQK
jgi:hypothetical protein